MEKHHITLVLVELIVNPLNNLLPPSQIVK